MGKFDNDATSCYNRIHCFMANVASRKFGQNKQVCIVQGRTLQEARYHLKTKLGISDNFIQHSVASPIYGTGQGSGNSPVYWVFISSILFECHASQAKGATFETPNKSIQITIHQLGFVDDTTNRTNDFTAVSQPDEKELVRLMQQDAQLWHDILWSSGGALELSKCSFHHIRFQFAKSGLPSMITGEFGPDLEVTTKDNQTINITKLSADKANKNLGFYRDPIGKQA